ncbi:MAG: C25 family cysteine peptidase [Thermoplasmatota archaeon]
MRQQRTMSFIILSILLISPFIAFAESSEADGSTENGVTTRGEETLRFQLEFDPAGVAFYDVEGFTAISKEGMDTTTIPGEPLVPISVHSFVLDPYSTEIYVDLISSVSSVIPAPGPLLGVPEQVPISMPREIPPSEADILLDGPIRALSSGYIRGYKVQDIAFQPVVPRQDGFLEVFTRIEGVIRFQAPAGMERTDSMQRPTSAFRSYLEGRIENPDDLDRFMARPFFSQIGSPLKQEDVQYVIVTDSSKVGDHLQKIRDWKQKKGVPARIVEMSFIKSNYNGTDDQEKVRNFLKDAVATWGVEYVLLGGDISVVPYRSTYVKSGSYTESDCAADLYYSDLDGSFNADNDTTYGEVSDSVDLRPDVIVGRAPAQTQSEMDTFVTKTLRYEIDPLTGYLDNMTLAGEYLDANTNSSLGMDLIKNSLLPSNVNATSLYDSAKGVFGNLNRPNFMGQVDLGLSYAFHSGHSNYNVMSVGTASNGYMYSSNIPAYSGDYRIGVMNSIGCIANRFSINDCIGELHVKESDGGSVVFIGNSRYGWYAPYSPGNGASEVYMRRMATELFSNGNNNMGAHFALAKDAYTGWAGSDNAYRWIQMALNMMGEPEMQVRTAEPSVLNITLPANIGRSYPDFYIDVKDANGSPVKDVLVCLQQSGYYSYNLSQSNGRAYFNFSTSSYDRVNVTATGYNFLPFTGNISIDIKPPNLSITSGDNATTGEHHLFNCSASDESGIQRVYLDMRYENQDSNDTVTYYLVNTGESWWTELPVPFNSTADLVYRFRGRDNSGNWNETGWNIVDVIDDDPPWFLEDSTASSGTTGDHINFTIAAQDNIDLSSMTLNLSWSGSEDHHEAEMTRSGDIWYLNWSVPADRVGLLEYRALVEDGAGNRNGSLEGNITVLDDDKPYFIEDLTDSTGNTSNNFNFSVGVKDNIGVESVFVEYWRGDYPEHETKAMSEVDGIWSYVIELSSSDLEYLHHIFHAVDTSGNWNHTNEGTVTVEDDDGPYFIRDWTERTATTGEIIEIRISVADNIRVDSTVLYCSVSEDPIPMERDDDGMNWTVEISIPYDSLEPIIYSFQAWDPFNNTNIVGDRTIEVADDDAPVFGEVNIPDSVKAGELLSVEIEVDDNIAVEDVNMEWWLGGSAEKQKLPMLLTEESYNTSFTVPIDAYGTLYFMLDAWDASGNVRTSDRFDVDIVEYVPPEDPGDDDQPVDPGDDDDLDPDDDDDDPACDDDDGDIPSIPTAGTDCDGDGMDDLWEYNNGLTIGLDDSDMDADEDGTSNLIEYRENTDPQDSSSFPLPGNEAVNNDWDTQTMMFILIGIAVIIGSVIVITTAVIVRKKRSISDSDEMVLDDEDDDDVMSWD